MVGSGTWYKMVFLFVGITNLSELASEGQTVYQISYQSSGQLSEGDRGEGVRTIQYLLSVIAEFYDTVPAPAIDGIYGPGTVRSVTAFQQTMGLPQNGVMDARTWEALYRAYEGITESVDRYTNVIPEAFRPEPGTTSGLTQFSGQDLTLGSTDFRGGSNG